MLSLTHFHCLLSLVILQFLTNFNSSMEAISHESTNNAALADTDECCKFSLLEKENIFFPRSFHFQRDQGAIFEKLKFIS